MDIYTKQASNRTLHQTTMPERVLLICDGLLRINADFLDTHLQKLLDELESVLFINAENPKSEINQGGQFTQLRNLKRTRYDFIPRFLATLEHHLASIRPEAIAINPNDFDASKIKAIELQLLDLNMTDVHQIQFDISARCESQNSFEIFLLGQRFGVLAGQPAFDAANLPISPKVFCQCLQDSLQALDLDVVDKITAYHLFERHIFSNFSSLLSTCNQYLVENGVLPNLSYIPFRNPELRNKKSPFATQNIHKVDAKKLTAPPLDDLNYGNVHPFTHSKSASTAEIENIDPTMIEESFTNLRQLLSKRKQLINKLDSLTNTYISEQPRSHTQSSESPLETLNTILDEFQANAVDNPHARVSIQHLKHDLLVQLRNLSTDSNEMTLNDEDSDAIDLVGMLMDDALKDVNPNSSASQLLSLMQAPLMRVVMKDKSFFSNHIHPARQMLNIIADTGFNWLDEHQKDDVLHNKITGIVSKTVRDFKGDNQELIKAYDETNQILQTLIKNADAAERRQVNAISGKERLIAARTRAEKTMSELVESFEIPILKLNLLNSAWADVMALTDLRQGSDSTDWLEQKQVAEYIIAACQPSSKKLDTHKISSLIAKIQDSLALIGYDQNEALSIAHILLDQSTSANPESNLIYAEKIRFGSDTQSANQNTYQLTAQQLEFVKQIKQLQVGTWFEFTITDSTAPARRKLAWKSELTNNLLFVNQRGQKTAEMMIEEFAIALSEGRCKFQIENKRSIFVTAFQNLLGSLRDLFPSKKDLA